MNKYRLVLGASVLLAITAVYISGTKFTLAPPPRPETMDCFKLYQAVKPLIEYSKLHNGVYPELTSPIPFNGASVEGFLVISNLPETHYSDFPLDSRTYPFLYFPINYYGNKKLPLFASNGDISTKIKILAASLTVFSSPSDGHLYRIVAYYYNNSSGPMDESAFQDFLKNTGNQ